MTGWWAGLSPAQAFVQCGGETHRLRWEDGQLRAVDHDDAAGERTLAALGAQRCACVDMLDAWERHKADEQVLILASRGPHDQLPVSAGGPAQHIAHGVFVMAGWTSYAPFAAGSGSYPSGAAAPQEDLFTLLGLGGGLPDRLLATVIAEWTRQLDDPSEACQQALPQLHAALYGRVIAALRAWLDRPGLDVELHMLSDGSAPAITEHDAGRMRADLPFAWLETVWAKGLSSVMGRFCLDATTTDGREWALTTIARDLDETKLVTITLPT